MSLWGVTLLDSPAQRLIQEADKWEITPGEMVHRALDAFNELNGIPRRLLPEDLAEMARREAEWRRRQEAEA